MKNSILIALLLISLKSYSQAPYTEFTMPNTLNTKECTYGTDSLNSIVYLVDNNIGRIYMLWVQSSQTFNPPTNLPSNWTMFRAYYPTAKSWTFDPVNGWLVLNDDNQNTWIVQH